MPNKYHNVKTSHNGSIYDSKAEAQYSIVLESYIRSKAIVGYDRQVPIPIVVNNKKVCTYVMDFVVNHGSYTELVEIKGFKTTTYRLKKKLLEATYLLDNPTIKFTVLEV